MPDAVVLFDAAGWTDEDGNTQYADKGERVSLPQKEFDRLKDLGAVAAPSSKDAKEAAAEAESEG